MVAVKFGLINKEGTGFKVYNVPSNSKDSYSPIVDKKGFEQSFHDDLNINRSLFNDLAIGCTINNTARIDYENGKFRRVGEPTEAAMKVLAEKICGNATTQANAFEFEQLMQSRLRPIAKLDFTSERKAMSTIVEGKNNKTDMLLKGAPDRILEKCTSFMSLSGG